MKKVIALAGETGSGKGVIAAYLEKKYGAKKIKFSDMLRDVLERYYLDYSRENLTTLSGAMREAFGQDIMSKVLRQDIEKTQEEVIVLDGARRKSDLDLIDNLPNFKFVYVDSSLKNRYERIFSRGEKVDEHQKTFEQFKNDHKLETEKTIPELREVADLVIENNGTLEELHQKIDVIMGEIKNK